MKKILVTRTDRLGDVLLSLPSILYLRTERPDWDITFLCPSSYHEILRLFCEDNKIHLVKKEELESLNFDAAILLHYDSTLAKKLKKNKIKYRVGPYSKLSSLIFLNKGIIQRRSLATKNEAEYCLDLIDLLIEKKESRNIPKVFLPVHPQAARKAKDILQALKINKTFFVIHPGMGGSALNLSVEKYEAILNLLRENQPESSLVLSSGTSFLDKSYREALLKSSPFLIDLPLQDLVTLSELFRLSKGVLAPSTGPLHLAHVVGTETFGFYSPVRTHRLLRWQPWGGQGKSHVFAPSVKCPGTHNCRYQKCPLFNCMEKMNWTAALKELV